MTAPGDFSSGDILTAADMNALTQGTYGYIRTATDFTLTSGSWTDIGSVTFTLATNRLLLIGHHFPLVDAKTTLASVTTGIVNSGAGSSGTTYCYSANYNDVSHSQGGWRINQFAAGTYTLYLSATVSAGTARINGAGGGARYTGMFVLDQGPY